MLEGAERDDSAREGMVGIRGDERGLEEKRGDDRDRGREGSPTE